MTKKQRNRKTVAQNKRNRIVNRRYNTTMKTLAKLFFHKISCFRKETNEEIKIILKKEISSLLNNFYSIVDKAVKKQVIHKNNAARKKSRVGKIVALSSS
jgi:small subunit ribosomal protein S20